MFDSSAYLPPTGDIEFIFSDDSLLVVNKLAGLLSVPGRGAEKQDSLATRLQVIFPDALVVHRLDMATSGLMVFARGPEIQRRLSSAFRDRTVEKRYEAIVKGKLLPESGEVNLPIAIDWPNRPLCKIDIIFGKPSLTRYRSLGFNGEATHVELEPTTGRTHQLRLHMAAIGHPILGDVLYGDAASASSLLLHATSLRFTHPLTGEHLNFTCDSLF